MLSNSLSDGAASLQFAFGLPGFMTTSNDHHTTVAASCNSDKAFGSLTGPKGLQTIW